MGPMHPVMHAGTLCSSLDGPVVAYTTTGNIPRGCHNDSAGRLGNLRDHEADLEAE